MITHEFSSISRIDSLSENSEKSFNTVEFKTHNSYSRHHFTSPKDMESYRDEAGTYTSAFVHSGHIRDYYKKHNNLEAYEGEVYSDCLIIKTDMPIMKAALAEARRIILHMESEYGIKREWIHNQFDGEYNFILKLPAGLFGGFKPSHFLPAVHALLARQLTGSLSLNWKVYKHSALLPMENTAVVQSRKYAVPLNHIELFSDDVNIDQLAEVRRQMPAANNGQFPVVPLLEKLKEDTVLRAAQSYDFFSLIFSPPIKGYINLRHLENKKGKKVKDEYSNIFLRTVCEAISMAEVYNGRENVYFGIAERESFGSGKKENCTKLGVIYADIDYGSEGHKEQAYFATKDNVLQMIKNLKIQPTATVHSGHGFQIFWKLNKPIDLKNKNELERAESLISRLNEMLHGDPVQNADRIFRVPNTLNIKSVIPVMSRIEEMDHKKVFSFEELEGWVSAEYKPAPKRAPKNSSIESHAGTSLKDLTQDDWNYLKGRCIWVQSIYRKAEYERHLGHKERFFIASLLSRFQGSEEEIHKVMKHCSDYDEEYTSYMITQISGSNYKPPLCSSLCNKQCWIIQDVAGNSPIALAYRREGNE